MRPYSSYPFLFTCPRCIVVLQNRGRIFAGNGCKWRGNVIKLCGSNGIRRCTQVVEGSGFEIVWSVRFCGSRTPWYLGPFRICCLRSAEELLHIFLRFAKRGGCEWGAILRVTSGTHKFSSNHYSKWLEIMWLVLKGEYLYMEAYRSGCNELHSKFRQKLGISSPWFSLIFLNTENLKIEYFLPSLLFSLQRIFEQISGKKTGRK